MNEFRIPLSTYRIQFNRDFRFEDAQRIASYLAAIGITDLYSSPILKARPGSTHGYDVVDASALNPELGSEDDFERLQQTLRESNLGFLLDIVPNHMAISADNSWWMSLLENGPHSRYINYFDLAVSERRQLSSSPRRNLPPDLTREKIVLPILGRPYGKVLENQELQVHFDTEGFFLSYFDQRFPLSTFSYMTILSECVGELSEGSASAVEIEELIRAVQGSPATSLNSRFIKETLWRLYQADAHLQKVIAKRLAHLNGVKGEPESFDELHELLEAQWYRIAYWRVASESINYRRFFDITDLIGVRVEDPEVFEARLSRIFQLIERGHVTGLRIDHIDGLHDPVAHLTRLQNRLGADRHERFYVAVEKILGGNETLPADFGTDGTTGYDFLNVMNGVFVDPEGLRAVTQSYRELTGTEESFDDIVYAAKKKVIEELFTGEMRALGAALGRLAAGDRNARDFSATELAQALVEVTASLDVYRTYIRSDQVSDTDRQSLQSALTEARTRSKGELDPNVFLFLERVFLVEPPRDAAAHKDEWIEFVMRWQQFTGRVMAKGVEDTAFYTFTPLISMNEVGGDPDAGHLSDPVAAFHGHNDRIAKDWPRSMNASSTHDTKRSEDVRARINVLSEIPKLWASSVSRWSNLNRDKRGTVDEKLAPQPDVEQMIYQTLLGVWPFDESEIEPLPERMKTFVEKSLREAKVHSSWIRPKAVYEGAVIRFVESLLAEKESPFYASFIRFQKKVAHHGFLNALGQVVLKIAAPGVPDFYQGSELWDFSLVDPDNRRPVDFDLRIETYTSLDSASGPALLSSLLRHWRDGRIKMFVTAKGLQSRRAFPEVFMGGSYRPLPGFGPRRENVCAFARSHGKRWILAAVPRLTTQLISRPKLPLGSAVWADSSLHLPPEAPTRWRNIFTHDVVETDASGRTHAMLLSEVFGAFPVAILVSE